MKLYEIRKEDMPKLVASYLDAFKKYPKMMKCFTEDKDRFEALKMLFWYYASYDLEYGRGYSTTSDVDDAIIFVDSEEMTCTYERHKKAGSFCRGYLDARNNLTEEQQEMWDDLFDEMDSLEKNLDLPEPHIYVDFLGVRSSCQGQGRGSRLVKAVIQESEERGLPLMLFTNTQEDVAFYMSHGFEIVGITESERFGFINTYLLRKPQKV